nr:MAG TPA: hypothetical protein [Caudoviricetes sp.]
MYHIEVYNDVIIVLYDVCIVCICIVYRYVYSIYSI